MRESITVQVGQCGNQIGACFWDLVVKEHASIAKDGFFDASMSTFFRNVDTRYEDPVDIPFGNGREKIKYLKARAVLVDTEEGVLSSTMNGPLGSLFDETELIKGVSGAGNNFAHGHFGYGPKYGERILESIRRATEKCDSIQSFLLFHSLGGGTGSGLGTYVLRLLEDHYPEVYRFATSVFPSTDDDVVTSPYNSVFAVNELREHADCVFPIENQALLDIHQIIEKKKNEKSDSRNFRENSKYGGASISERHHIKNPNKGIQAGEDSLEKPFDKMNSIAAHMISNLTSCSRFPGQLNVDIGEVTTNLVPFPKVHFVMSSMSPLYTLSDVAAATRTKNIDQTFSSAFSKENQLCTGNPIQSKYLACALLVRGGIQLSDVNRNISRMMGQLDMVHWNQEGFKVGLCSVPPVKHPYSLLCLSNNCCVRSTFKRMEQRFRSLYDKRKAFVHHYTQYVDESYFAEALESVRAIQHDYSQLQSVGTLTNEAESSGQQEIDDMRQRLRGRYQPRSIFAPLI